MLFFILDVSLMLLRSVLGEVLHKFTLHLLTIIFPRLQIYRVFSLIRICFIRIQPVTQTLHNVVLSLCEVRVHRCVNQIFMLQVGVMNSLEQVFSFIVLQALDLQSLFHKTDSFLLVFISSELNLAKFI